MTKKVQTSFKNGTNLVLKNKVAPKQAEQNNLLYVSKQFKYQQRLQKQINAIGYPSILDYEEMNRDSRVKDKEKRPLSFSKRYTNEGSNQ